MTKKVQLYSTETQIKYFDQYLNNPDSWVLKGDDLMVSVRILKNHCSFYTKSFLNRSKNDRGKPLSDEDRTLSTIQMLKAMALECYLKALWVHLGNSLSQKPGEYGKIPNTKEHDLVTLANALKDKNGYKFSDDEMNLLGRISPYIITGRYPLHKKYNSLDNVPFPKGTKMAPVGAIIMSDRGDEKIFEQIISKIKNKIENSN